MTLHDDSLERAHAAAGPEGKERGTVLLIDGHGTLCVEVRRHLAARYRLLEAADATAGLRLACHHQPDLVIRGTGTPGLDGYIPCRRSTAGDLALSPGDQVFLERVEKLITENLGDDEFGTDALVRKLATSRTRLYHRLRHLADRSPAELIMERRLEQAARRFAEGSDSVSEVAFGVGFKSVSHFSRRFKQRYGIRPSALLGRDLGPCPPATASADILDSNGHDGNTSIQDRDVRSKDRDAQASASKTGSLV